MAAVLHLENVELDGRYRVERRLATGVETEIFLARDKATRRAVVVKAFVAHLRRLSPPVEPAHPRLAAFHREGVRLDRLSHPNIVRRLASGRAHDAAGAPFDYHVLEYLAGGTLDALSRSAGGLPPARALPLLRQAAAALSHCHALGVVHGDVEPTNLLLADDGQTLKLADFGRAADDETPCDEGGFPSDGVRLYAPPECVADGDEKRVYSAATDVYGLAKTLYAVLSGEPPAAYVGRPIEAPPPRMAAQPSAEALLGVLRRATATPVTARYPSVAAFWAEVEGILTSPAENTLTPTSAPSGAAAEGGHVVDGERRKSPDAPDGDAVAAESSADPAPTTTGAFSSPTTTRWIGVGVFLAAVVLFIGGLTALYRFSRALVRDMGRRPPPTARASFKVKILAPTKVYAVPTETPPPSDWLGDLAAGVEVDVLDMQGRFYRVRPERWIRRKAATVTEGWIPCERTDGGH